MIRLSFKIIAIGQWKKCPERDLFDRYTKRLFSYGKLSLIEIKPSTKENEGKDILKSISSTDSIIALDERGETLTSTELASTFEELSQTSSHLTCIIGGADGLSNAIKNRANKIFSLSSFTWPHMMVRPMIAEQIYRAMTLLNNHPYHRD